MNYPAGSVVPPSDGGTRSRRYDLAGRVLWISLGISAVIHLLAIVIYPLYARRLRPDQASFPVPVTSGAPAQGVDLIRLFNLTETNEAEAPQKPEERPKPVPQPIVVPARPGRQETTEEVQSGEEEVLPLSAAERLRPHPEKSALWRPVDPALTRLTTKQKLELELAGKLDEWRDSVAAAKAEEEAATDWTYTDKSGNKWGVSPGELHLGGLTIPLPFSFGTTPGNREAVQKRTEEWKDINRAAAQGAIRQGWKERAQAIRERRDKERAAAKADTSGVKH